MATKISPRWRWLACSETRMVRRASAERCRGRQLPERCRQARRRTARGLRAECEGHFDVRMCPPAGRPHLERYSLGPELLSEILRQRIVVVQTVRIQGEEARLPFERLLKSAYAFPRQQSAGDGGLRR